MSFPKKNVWKFFHTFPFANLMYARYCTLHVFAFSCKPLYKTIWMELYLCLFKKKILGIWTSCYTFN